jgi:preprotein translocase subunit SecF
LIIGITSGAYSSIFIAGPLLASWKIWGEKKLGEKIK